MHSQTEFQAFERRSSAAVPLALWLRLIVTSPRSPSPLRRLNLARP